MTRAAVVLAAVTLSVPLFLYGRELLPMEKPHDVASDAAQGQVAWVLSSRGTASAAPAQTTRSAQSASSVASAPKPTVMDGVTETLSIIEQRRRDRWKKADVEPRPIKIADEHPLAGEAKYLNQVGVYLTAGSMKRLDFVTETMDKVQEGGGNALIFDVKGSFVYFQTDAAKPNELGLVLPLVDLPAVLAMARGRGMYTMGRFIAIKDDGLSGKRPDVLVKNPNNGRALSPGWVDPQNDLVLEYNGQVICALAEAGIDEINLDYIRFSTAYVGDLRVFSGPQKADRVEKFIKMVRERIDSCGPRTRFGISTYAILGWAYDINMETLGQDVKRFAPYVDVISPMAYPATFTSEGYYVPGKHPRSRMYWLVYRTLTGYKEFLGPEHAWKIRPWIQGYSVSARDFREQMDAVTDAGACGFTIWNAGNNYAQFYQALGPWEMPEACKS